MALHDGSPRPLLLGKGWFPDHVGGLERYYRGLLEHLPEATGLVIGTASGAPTRLHAVSGHTRPLPLRLHAYWRAAQRAADSVDVVDAHFALYALAPLWLGRLRAKPTIVHFHGPWADESLGAGDRSRMRRAARRLVERAAYRRAEHLVVLSSSFRQVLVQRYGVSPWRVSVEPPGVDLGRFSPGSAQAPRRQLGLAESAFVAVAVRRLVPRMGLEFLLEAWRQALDDLPQGSALLIAGDGPLREPLARAAADPALVGSVRILGSVTDQQLVDLYRAADIAVVPTLAHEGFGLSVIEAAACGTPSIVTAVGGLPESVAGLDDSLVVAPANAGALRARLLRARVERPSRTATRAYAERFEWTDLARRHRGLLRRVVNGPDDRRLRVVYLDHVARLSGAEIALLRLLPHLDGVHPHVILGEHGPLVSRLHQAGISTEVLPMPSSARDARRHEILRRAGSARLAAGTSAYVVRLAARLRRLQPDLVHANSLKAGVYGSLAARLAGLPFVWHVRDRVAEDYLPRSAAALVRRLSRALAAAVVANSQSTMTTLGPLAGPPPLYAVIPDVIAEVKPRRATKDGPLRFGMLGRLAPWKGQDVFLRAFARAFPDGVERAVVVGGALFGEQEYAASLEGLAEQLTLSGRVELRGHRPDVWAELAGIDVLVHASTTPEPFGLVILEGMAAGVPVIAPRAGGPAEILTHDVTGVLYDPGDVEALAGAMRRMLDPGLRQRLSSAAEHELERYSPPRAAAELERLYARLLADGNALPT